ncbi:NAD(P)/FAD-dependent oxidoreductase [Acidovorax lacteus]|uniref:NAD(P)/FAD-dependent oxidoreductase n=1 Tax=Acidovorax lacteus TaxID=1924988 RepID=A0ABP8L2L2_9BURK
METEAVDTVVIGAGVVGLAVARALALAGREVLVLEAEGAFGTQTSSRNSEVIHAGLYYPPGSLKARLCVRGKALLYAYCAERAVAHRRCGKLVVATHDEELPALRKVRERAAANGVHDLRWLSADEARAMEPALRCVAALHSPSTGIVDSHGLMLALLADLEHAGGQVVYHTRVQGLTKSATGGRTRVVTADGLALDAAVVVNAAGLHAPQLAATAPNPAGCAVPRAHYARGHYFALQGRAPFQRLVYPVPEAAGLGVHLTLDLAGAAKFGPDVQWVEDPDDLRIDPARGEVFYGEVRKYWPGLPDGALVPAYAGMRPKISGPGEPAADFLLLGPAEHGSPGLLHLLGIESPGLTSCLAIAQEVLQRLALDQASAAV